MRTIEDIKEKISCVKNDLNDLIQPLIEAHKEFMIEFTNQYIDSVIKKNPDKIENCTKQEIGEIKNQVKKIQDSIPEIIETKLTENGFWPHQKKIEEDLTDFNKYFDKEFESNKFQNMDELEREIIGWLGKIFIDNDFIVDDIKKSWDKGEEKLVYRYGFPHSDRISKLNISYSTQLKTYYKFSRELAIKSKELREWDVKNKWDNA